jgi:cathepsin A (carboxypeptidase C)
VLIYAGGQILFATCLVTKWSGATNIKAATPKAWMTYNGHGGDVANSGHFTFLRVFNAGNMVPHDQPANAEFLVLWKL